MAQDRKEYLKAYYEAHKDEHKARCKEWRESHREEFNDYHKEWRDSHREEYNSYQKEWRESHKEEYNSYQKAYRDSHKEEFKVKHNERCKAYQHNDVNSLGQTKASIRTKSNIYLSKYGKKIPGYEIHHCCTYTEPYKFIYCSKEMHHLIHSYLRQHNIDADSDHYELIKHLLDDTVVLYGL